jgi:hypothetical protein
MKKVLLLLIIVLISSCRTADFHFNKFIKKGGKLEPITKTVTLTDTIKGKDGKDSLIYVKIPCICPEPVIETRWRTRFDLKRFNDSLKHIRQLYKDSTRTVVKVDKNDTKEHISDNRKEKAKSRHENRSSWWIIWIAVGFFLKIIVQYIIRYFKGYLIK